MSEKIHDIDDREFSESTIKNALEKSCGVVFGEKKYFHNAKFRSQNDTSLTLIWCHGCEAWYLLTKEGETYASNGVKKRTYSCGVTITELESVNASAAPLMEVK